MINSFEFRWFSKTRKNHIFSYYILLLNCLWGCRKTTHLKLKYQRLYVSRSVQLLLNILFFGGVEQKIPFFFGLCYLNVVILNHCRFFEKNLIIDFKNRISRQQLSIEVLLLQLFFNYKDTSAHTFIFINLVNLNIHG